MIAAFQTTNTDCVFTRTDGKRLYFYPFWGVRPHAYASKRRRWKTPVAVNILSNAVLLSRVDDGDILGSFLIRRRGDGAFVQGA